MNEFFELYDAYLNDSPVAFGLGFFSFAFTSLFASLLWDVSRILYEKLKNRKK